MRYAPHLIRNTYDHLLKEYGPQGWWPVTPEGQDQPQYRPGTWPELTAREQFEILTGALLTQNTAWLNVEKALKELHRARWMDPKILASAPEAELSEKIHSAGFFRQKASRLKAISQRVLEEGGMTRLLSREGPGLRRRLLTWHGLGRETVDSILLYAGHHPLFVVDAYTRRIFERLGVVPDDIRYDDLQSHFMRVMPQVPSLYGEYHALLVAHAKERCHKSAPECDICCLTGHCERGSLAGG